MKNLWLVVCAATLLAACGSAGTGSSLNNVTMQGGQWEFAVVPDNLSSPLYIDVNLPASSGSLSASNALIFNPSVVGLPGALAPIYCGDLSMNGNITEATIKGDVSWGQPSSHFANFIGNLASNGQSISKGTYAGQICWDQSGPGVSGPQVKASLAGYVVSPVSGTFTGILNSSLHGADTVTFYITQNPDFSLSVSGTSSENGVTSNFVPSTVPTENSVTGATIYITGLSNNVNGSDTLFLIGHLNPDSTQITITNMTIGTNENFTGALTKQ